MTKDLRHQITPSWLVGLASLSKEVKRGSMKISENRVTHTQKQPVPTRMMMMLSVIIWIRASMEASQILAWELLTLAFQAWD